MSDDILNAFLPQITQISFGTIMLLTVIRWLLNVEQQLGETIRILKEINNNIVELNKSINDLTNSTNTLTKRFRYS